jgi:hypothetical protein
MGCDFYIETYASIIFKDKSKDSILLSIDESYRNDLFDGQILSKKIVYNDDKWNCNYENYKINKIGKINEIESIEEIRISRDRL